MLSMQAVSLVSQLNPDQKHVFDTIIARVSCNSPGFFFVCGHGGTGKTFLWNAIITHLRSEKKIVLAVASSGVASLLLPKGRIAHSRFKIPFDLNEAGTCSIKRGTMLAELIKVSALIIWDEAPMTHRHCFEALDRTLRDNFLKRNPPMLLFHLVANLLFLVVIFAKFYLLFAKDHVLRLLMHALQALSYGSTCLF
jgi:Cdc6-like AAA superfamily ATPase